MVFNKMEGQVVGRKRFSMLRMKFCGMIIGRGGDAYRANDEVKTEALAAGWCGAMGRWI